MLTSREQSDAPSKQLLYANDFIFLYAPSCGPTAICIGCGTLLRALKSEGAWTIRIKKPEYAYSSLATNNEVSNQLQKI
jgi:hypothetical protein